VAVGALTLGRPTPAPFRDHVVLELTLAARGEVDARVYDLLGHEVGVVQRGALAAGRHTLSWDGRDRAGRPLASGMYVVRARHGGHTRSHHLLLVR
jgi:flagellar hook assembly protein FlgD